MTKQELAAIESRANAATREPWIVDGTYVPTASLSAVSVYGMGMEVAECQMDADGAFIAAARVDVPALIAEVRRLRAELREGMADEVIRLREQLAAIDTLHKQWAIKFLNGYERSKGVERLVDAIGKILHPQEGEA
jgi:hypothetical protein